MFRKLLLIAALLATEIALFGAILQFVPFGKIELTIKFTSFVLAHWFLACFWLSFGAMKAPGRQLLCTGILALVSIFISAGDSDPTMTIASSQAIVALSWYFYVAMFFLRRLGGMRIGFSKSNRERRENHQFGLGALLGFMVVVAIPLALSRLAFAVNPNIAKELPVLAAMFGLVCVTALPLSISLFANRNSMIKISLSLGWCLLATFGIEQFGPRNWLQPGPMLALIWVQVAFILFAARLMGLRWEGHEPRKSDPIRAPISG